MDYPSGTLIHYVDYTCPIQGKQHFVGLLLRTNHMRGTYSVLCEGQEVEWMVFKCEVQNANR